MNKDKKKQFLFKIKINFWSVLFFLALVFFVAPLIIAGVQLGDANSKLEISQLVADVKEKKVKKVMIEEEKLVVEYNDGTTKFSTKEKDQSFADLLESSGVDPASVSYTVVDQSLTKAFGDVAGILLPVIIMGAIFYFLTRSQMKGANDVFSFGRSKAKLFAKGKQDITFADVAGVDDAKKELEEVVDFLKNPAKYKKIGARTPKGVLLFGPSGVGKTLLAKAVAGEAGVPFFSMAGSEFMEMLVGIGASVTGDTPILIKKDGETSLTTIGEFVDKHYKKSKGGLVKVKGVETLGLKPEVNGFWGSRSSKRPLFGGSKWQSVDSVYRHKVKEIYEIEYLGGKLRTTGDHSVFVRENGGIRAKEVRDLKTGDVLTSLPQNTRAWDIGSLRTRHFIKKHEFSMSVDPIYLDVWLDNKLLLEKYNYVLSNKGMMSQYMLAYETGVSQATIGNWQRRIHEPQRLSKKLVKLNLPETVQATPDLMKLFGYYTAEGRGAHGLSFSFNAKETNLVEDVVKLMTKVFGVGEPKLEFTNTNSVNVIYYSAHLGRFFAKHCGNGSHNKHVPELLWTLPGEFFFSFLKGYWEGDGYRTKDGKLSMTSVSHGLIRELTWLFAMHGIKAGVKYEIQKEGRSILRGRSLPETESWTLIVGKTGDPFSKNYSVGQFKRSVVKSVRKKKYDGFVYDLCGVENEAFFGGESPILLHNSRVRDLFGQAKAAAPAIIFIDEIDAIGRHRGRSGFVGGHDEREQTLNQILVEMDGFTPNESVIVLAATNRGDLLDPALLRPGRFDRRVVLDMPDKEGRMAILKIHARGKKFAKGIKWESVADRTVGFSGADLENMLNEAAIGAAREGQESIEMGDIEEAATKVKLGPAKKKIQSDRDKKITAYHEAGHAIVTHFLPETDPVQRISIVARGMSLGHTLIPPAADRTHDTKSHILDQIAAMLGGRAAEELVFNEMTTGAANDIAQATKLARAMVIEWGMSDLGPINFGPDSGMGDFGQVEWFEQNAISPHFQEKIDTEVKKIVEAGHRKAARMVKEKKTLLDKVSEALLKSETIDKDEFEKIVGKKINGSN